MKSLDEVTMNRNEIQNLTIDKHITKAMGVKEWGLILFLSIIWGGSFFFVEVALKEMTPLTIVLCRVGFASIILLGFVHLKGKKMPTSLGLWGAFLIMGALNLAECR